jgi:hypothetical protein
MRKRRSQNSRKTASTCVAVICARDDFPLDSNKRSGLGESGFAKRFGTNAAEACSNPYWNGGKIDNMAKLTLVYGMRLLPAEEVEEVGEAQVKLKNGREARVTLHIVEGSKEDIEKQLRQSIDAFFDLYPEI